MRNLAFSHNENISGVGVNINFIRSCKKNKCLGKNLGIESFYWHDKDTKLLNNIFANLTIFPHKSIITFSNKLISNLGVKDSKELFKSSDSKDVIGISLSSSNVSKVLLNEYIYKLPRLSSSENINDIKKEFFIINSYEYISSIAYSISKEISSMDEFNPILGGTKIEYAGIVGSFLKKKNSPNSILNATSLEVDLLIFIPTEKIESLISIYEIASEVSERYSIADYLQVRIFEDISPLKNTKCLKNVKVIDIQLIINDSKFTYSKEPSPLVVYHRNNNNLPFPIYKNDFTSLKDVYPDFSVDKNKLLDSPLGIRDLKMSISTEELFVRFWNKTTFRMEERKVKLDSDEIKQFCLYAAKWSIINYLIHIKHFSETSDEISSLLDEIDSEIEISYIQKEEILSGSKEKCIELLNIIENKLSV